MLKRIILSGLLLTALTTSKAYACDEHGKTGIAPENDMYIPVNAKFDGGLTKTEFDDVLQKISDLYTPIVKDLNGTLVVNRLWDNGTVNASAVQLFNLKEKRREFHLNMYGGMARHPLMTKDTFALIVCHELGHHLAGAPRKGLRWASNEGQSDYWASTKCLRKYYEINNKEEVKTVQQVKKLSSLMLDGKAHIKCSKNYKVFSEYKGCMRTVIAGKTLSVLFTFLKRQSNLPSLKTPAAKIVSLTNNSHPDPQCRLDTYFSGALCTLDAYTDVSQNSSNGLEGNCNRVDGYEESSRPLCWYKPAKIEAQEKPEIQKAETQGPTKVAQQ